MPRKPPKTRLAARDSLSNLAASLNTGRDKASADAFFVADLGRAQVEAMYRGDWLARKVVDIVPYDSVRAWREWAGDRAAVEAVERAERSLGLRRAVQRAMVLGRLYGGGAIILGTDEGDAAALAAPLHPEAVRPGSLRFLHVVSRWQLGVADTVRDPLDPHYGEPDGYRLAAPGRAELVLHPSRVVRFLGNPYPDPLLYGAPLWSDSVLQALYDAVHGVALATAGATSLVHEAKVDVVTVPGLSEHLSNAATTAQLSQRFAYAATMKSINNLLLLGDGETWARERVDFGGLPELVRTFLQVAAGAADVPVTRLLGQSPAGLSSTGDSDTRNYYDMIAARQELDLRPQLERIDALVLRSAGVEPGALRFSFRPLWQLSAQEKAQVALAKAQATQVYAGAGLWPAGIVARLAEGQLLEDGTYPTAGAVFGGGSDDRRLVADFDPAQPRDPQGRWTAGGWGARSPSSEQDPSFTRSESAGVRQSAGGTGTGTPSSMLGSLLSALNPIRTAQAHEFEPQGSRGSVKPTVSISTSAVPSLPTSIMRVAQSGPGPLLPGGIVQEPIQGTDPLDPVGLNKDVPSAQEQQALTATLDSIQKGTALDLTPHSYENYPHPKTGAVLPPSSDGYTTYDVPLGGRGRGAARIIIDNGSKNIYYTNNHYRSFFSIIIQPTP